MAKCLTLEGLFDNPSSVHAPGLVARVLIDHARKQLEKEGFKVTYLKPDEQGAVRSEHVAAALTAETTLVSVMHVNNETGVINDIAAIGKLCRERGVVFHVDAAQSAGKLSIDVE